MFPINAIILSVLIIYNKNILTESMDYQIGQPYDCISSINNDWEINIMNT